MGSVWPVGVWLTFCRPVRAWLAVCGYPHVFMQNFLFSQCVCGYQEPRQCNLQSWRPGFWTESEKRTFVRILLFSVTNPLEKPISFTSKDLIWSYLPDLVCVSVCGCVRLRVCVFGWKGATVCATDVITHRCIAESERNFCVIMFVTPTPLYPFMFL